MKTRIDDPIHNPFHNRFHVRVHSRLDEMPSYTHMVRLHSPIPLDQQTKTDRHSRYWIPALAGAFALVLVVVFSAALLSQGSLHIDRPSLLKASAFDNEAIAESREPKHQLVLHGPILPPPVVSIPIQLMQNLLKKGTKFSLFHASDSSRGLHAILTATGHASEISDSVVASKRIQTVRTSISSGMSSSESPSNPRPSSPTRLRR